MGKKDPVVAGLELEGIHSIDHLRQGLCDFGTRSFPTLKGPASWRLLWRPLLAQIQVCCCVRKH